MADCLHQCPVCNYVGGSKMALYGHVIQEHFRLLGHYNSNKKGRPVKQCWCGIFIGRDTHLHLHLLCKDATLEQHYHEYLLGVKVDVP